MTGNPVHQDSDFMMIDEDYSLPPLPEAAHDQQSTFFQSILPLSPMAPPSLRSFSSPLNEAGSFANLPISASAPITPPIPRSFSSLLDEICPSADIGVSVSASMPIDTMMSETAFEHTGRSAPTMTRPGNGPLAISTKPRTRLKSEDWDMQKENIRLLYVVENLSLPDTMKRMEEIHGFSASAAMYKKKSREWGFEKNLNNRQSTFMTKKALNRLNNENKQTEFTIKGRPVPMDKIRRHCRNIAGSSLSSIGETPTALSYHTPEPRRPEPVRPAPQGQSSEPNVSLQLTWQGLNMDDLIQLQSRASDLAEEHRHTESHPMFVEALDGLEALMGPTHTMTILALNSFVTSCISQGCFHDAESRLQKSMKDHHSELGNANPKTYQSIARLGSYYKRQKRYGESEKLIRHAIKGLESVYSFDLEAQFNSTNNSVVELIKIYCMNYDFENAENECLQLIAKSEALKGPYQRRCLEFKHYLSHIYEHYVWHSLVYRNNNFLKDPPLHKFEQLLLELIDDSEERSASIAITACSFELLLWQYFKQNQVDKLESLLDRAGSKVKSVPGLSSIMDLPTMEDVRALKTDIPTPFSEVGKHGEAERWFTHLQRQIEDAFGEGYRRYFQTLMLQALDDLKQGLWEQAEPLLLGAQVIRRRCRTRRSPCYLTRWSRCVSTKGSLVLEHPTLSDPTEEH